jgi:hypothetical protein
MRIYIIGNDGITLCREVPTAVNEGEIAVDSVAVECADQMVDVNMFFFFFEQYNAY